jgi:hypothetical protein
MNKAHPRASDRLETNRRCLAYCYETAMHPRMLSLIGQNEAETFATLATFGRTAGP